jgi:hypothetical protein
VTFSSLALDGDRLGDFKVDGKALGPLVALGDGTAAMVQGNRLRLISAYEAQSGELTLCVELLTGASPLEPQPAFARYTPKRGRSVLANGSVRPDAPLPPNRRMMLMMSFPEVPLGGYVEMGMFTPQMKPYLVAKLDVAT